MDFKKPAIRSRFVNGKSSSVKFSIEGFVIDSEKIKNSLQELCNCSFYIGEYIVLVYVGESNDYFAFRGFGAAMDFIKLNVRI